MTSGLEWTVKVTAQDMPHLLDRFAAEFETYWLQEEFSSFNVAEAGRFRCHRMWTGRRSDGPLSLLCRHEAASFPGANPGGS